MAALGGSRHALNIFSTQIDIPPIIKKSLTPITGYSGHEDEQSHHLNTSYVSVAPVCVLQIGAFCLSKKFFEKISENIRRFFKTQYCPAKRGKHHQLSTRKEVRMWNLTVGNFLSNALFRSIVIRCCIIKRATLTKSFADIRQKKLLFLT